MDQQTATSIRAREEALRAFLAGRTSYKPEEVAHLNPPTNEERSALEIFELHRDKPETFMAYVPWGEGQAKHFGGSIEVKYSRAVTTWTGEQQQETQNGTEI